MRIVQKCLHAIGTVVEISLIYAALLYAVGAVFSLPWRSWLDDAVWARATPFVITGIGIMAIVPALRPRYGLIASGPNTGRAQRNDRGFAALALLTAPLCMLLGVERFSDWRALDLISASALVGSTLAVLSIALMEEFIHRYVLLGRLIRVGIPAVLAVVIQAGLFLLVHGKKAMTSPETMSWYLVGGATLGTLYLATRSFLLVVLLHAVVDICVAQTGPANYWMTHRIVESMALDWPRQATLVWGIGVITYWVIRWRGGLPPGPERISRSSYNRAPWMTPSPRWRTPRPIRATPSPARAARSANSPMN